MWENESKGTRRPLYTTGERVTGKVQGSDECGHFTVAFVFGAMR